MDAYSVIHEGENRMSYILTFDISYKYAATPNIFWIN